MKSGLDLSHWNGEIDFQAIKNTGYTFVILKCGGSDGKNGGMYTDVKFYDYYDKAIKSGLHVGCYYFVGKGFQGTEVGKAQAEHCLSIIKDLKFSMPVYLDVETTPKNKRVETTDACISWLEAMEDKGYFVGVYGSDISTFKERVEADRLKPYSLWVARYGAKPSYIKTYGMWQKSSTGHVSGCKSNVDIDVMLTDYPSIIKSKHFNNY